MPETQDTTIRSSQEFRLRMSQVLEKPEVDAWAERAAQMRQLMPWLMAMTFGVGAVYTYVYLQERAWQVLGVVGIVALALLCELVAYLLVRGGRLDAAGYVLIWMVVGVFVGIELLWAGAGLAFMLFCPPIILVLGPLVLPGRRRFWWVASILVLVGLVLANWLEPLPRFPISQSPILSIVAPGITLAGLVVIGWQLVRVFTTGTLRLRLLVSFVGVVFLPLFIILLLTVSLDRQAGTNQVGRQLESVSQLKRNQIQTWIDVLHEDLENAFLDEELQSHLVTLFNPSAFPAARDFAYTQLSNRAKQIVQNIGRFEELLLLDLEGKVLLSTEGESQEDKILSAQPYFQQGLLGPFVQEPTLFRSLGRMLVVFSQPVQDRDGKVVGVLAGRASLEALNAIMVERSGLGETGETYLVGDNGALLTEARFGAEDWQYGMAGEYVRSEAVEQALETRQSGLLKSYESYYDEAVIGFYRWVSELRVVVVSEQRLSEALAASEEVISQSIAVVVGAGVFAVVISLFVSGGIINPLSRLAETVSRIASGEFTLLADIERRDEIGDLARAFNAMTAQLRDLIDNLERRVLERTRDLELTAELGRTVASIRDLDTLLNYAINLIADRTPYYHVQIFLLDREENPQYALLRASTGEVGQQLLEAQHRLAIGSSSIIGQIVDRGQPLIVHDTQAPGSVHQPNPLLPNTRSEMALPLRVGTRVIGALDVQSLAPNTFDDADVRVFSLLADQLAIAIDNARLFHESAVRLEEIDKLNRRLVGAAWKDYLRQQGTHVMGAVADMQGAEHAEPLTPLMEKVLESGSIITDQQDSVAIVSVPLAHRGVNLGVLEFEIEAEALNPETLELVQALTSRLMSTLETIRLFEQSQRLAQRERVVNQVSTRLTGKTEMSDLLQTAVRELGRALQMPHTAVRLMGIQDDLEQDGREPRQEA